MRISDWSSDVCSSDLMERFVGRVLALGCLLMLLGACAATPSQPVAGVPAPSSPTPPASPGARPAPAEAGRSKPASLPEVFESEDFVVTFAKADDTTESLAPRFLGDPAKAWMIEDYHGTAR